MCGFCKTQAKLYYKQHWIKTYLPKDYNYVCRYCNTKWSTQLLLSIVDASKPLKEIFNAN